jgi:hypothetical protein
MRKDDVLLGFARRLLFRGVAARYIHKALRELADHREDLTTEGLEQGLTLAEAQLLAARKLGNPETLADAFVKQMQDSTWVGRHPLVSFCVLPLAAVVAWWAAFVVVAGWGTGALQWSANRTLPQPNWQLLQDAVEWCPIAAAAVLPFLFCWVARRSFRGFKWAFVACGILSLHSGFQFARLKLPEAGRHADFVVGYRIPPSLPENVSGLALPLLVFALFVLLQINTQKKRLTV